MYIGVLPRKSRIEVQQSSHSAKEQPVNHRETVNAVARRLPHQTRREVDEVLRWAYAFWREALERGEVVRLPEIGNLQIEVQSIRSSGAIRQIGVGRLQRLYGRFRLAPEVRRHYRRGT